MKFNDAGLDHGRLKYGSQLLRSVSFISRKKRLVSRHMASNYLGCSVLI
jgi:hypothetical protein